MEKITESGIHIYPLPDSESDEEDDYKEQVRQLKESVPFVAVGSTSVLDMSGCKARGRQYPWGIIEVENPNHCDFIKLGCLSGIHMQDLTEVTQDVHYENYRSERLARNGSAPVSSAPVTKKAVLPPEEQQTPDMRTALQEKEAQIRQMQEMMAKMQAQLQDKK